VTPAEAHVWIAVYAAEFVRKRDAVSAIVAADVALGELKERGQRILPPLNMALRQGSDIP
jgi:hypothetical protein